VRNNKVNQYSTNNLAKGVKISAKSKIYHNIVVQL